VPAGIHFNLHIEVQAGKYKSTLQLKVKEIANLMNAININRL